MGVNMDSSTKMDYIKLKTLIPNGITAIRLILIAFLLYAYFSDLRFLAVFIFIFAAATDAIDGYVARKLDSTSSVGAYFDVIADFVFILAIFSAFVLNSVYPFWILLILIFMFLQFIIGSKSKRLSYDPVGKYYGSFLFLVIFLTLLGDNNFLNSLLLILMVGFTIAAIVSRFLFFRIRQNQQS